jgi:peptidoglycan/LPS O-acetylase OafA/YrhL
MDATSPTGGPREEPLPSLTGLRLVAALCVLVAHSGNIIPQVLLPKYLSLGYHIVFFGMTLFFVLSGFVITYNYLDAFRTRPASQALYGFLSARFARLFPLYLFLLVVTLATTPLSVRWRTQDYFLPLYITQAQSYLFFASDNVFQEGFLFFGIVWSIATEWFFYLCFPAVAFALNRARSPRAVIAGAVGCVLLGVAVQYHLYQDRGCHYTAFLANKGAAPSERALDVFTTYLAYNHPLYRLSEFVLGCLAARLYLLVRAAPPSRRETYVAHGLFAAFAAGALVLEKFVSSRNPLALTAQGVPLPEVPFLSFLRMNVLHAPFIAYLIFYSVRYASPVSWLLNQRPVVAGGEASYSIYLLHPWLLGLFSFQPSPPGAVVTKSALAEGLFRCGVIFLFVAILARGLYLLVELPGKRLFKGVCRGLAPPYMPALVSKLLCALAYLLPAAGVALSLHLYYRHP